MHGVHLAQIHLRVGTPDTTLLPSSIAALLPCSVRKYLVASKVFWGSSSLNNKNIFPIMTINTKAGYSSGFSVAQRPLDWLFMVLLIFPSWL